MQASEKLPRSSKDCQCSKLCSILQISERCLRLCSLAAVDREGTGSLALQALEHFKDQARASRVLSFAATYKYLKDISDFVVLQLLTRLCSILEVSERYLRLHSLTTVDKAAIGGSALQA